VSAPDVNTLDTVIDLAVQQFGGDPAKIDPDAPIQQLGADSLGYLEFLFELEGHFNITIEQDDAKQLKSLRDLGTLIDRLVEAGVSQPG
jgi:acyl carrier protein